MSENSFEEIISGSDDDETTFNRNAAKAALDGDSDGSSDESSENNENGEDSKGSEDGEKKKPSLRVVVVVVVIAAILVALGTAFIWPGWAVRSSSSASNASSTSSTTSTSTPTISAVALPSDATDLMKILPDSVGSYARQSVTASTTWESTQPIEEYTVVYSNGTESDNVTLVFAQWSTSDYAAEQYNALTSAQTGTNQAQGSVKVSGETKGSYAVYADSTNSANSIAIWQNDTVVFQASGPQSAVSAMYQQFPY